MSRKHPSHTANHNRRTRPIGPVNGLAIARPLPHIPIWEEPVYEDAPSRGNGETRRRIASKYHWHPMSMQARLVAVSGGNISLNQVDRQIKLTPKQRALAAYTSLDEIKWPGNAPFFDEEQWHDMVDGQSVSGKDETLLPGESRLLVVRMMLEHGMNGAHNSGFNAMTQSWDVANPAEHIAGMTVTPAGGLMISRSAIHNALVQVLPTNPVASPVSY